MPGLITGFALVAIVLIVPGLASGLVARAPLSFPILLGHIAERGTHAELRIRTNYKPTFMGSSSGQPDAGEARAFAGLAVWFNIRHEIRNLYIRYG